MEVVGAIGTAGMPGIVGIEKETGKEDGHQALTVAAGSFFFELDLTYV